MMSFFAASARAMKLRCASPFNASNRPKANLPEGTFVADHGAWAAGLLLAPSVPRGSHRRTGCCEPGSGPPADEPLAVEQPDARPDQEDVEHQHDRPLQRVVAGPGADPPGELTSDEPHQREHDERRELLREPGLAHARRDEHREPVPEEGEQRRDHPDAEE